MRYDAHKDGPRPNWRIYVDGAPLKDVVAFDDVEGWVEIFARDEHGKLVIDREKHAVVRIRRCGPVTVKM